MPEHLFIPSYDELTKRHAVLEDDGLTAWLYLHGPSDDLVHTAPVDKACFVSSHVAPIDANDAEGYRPNPPPIAKGYAPQGAFCDSPDMHTWIIEWSEDGRRVLSAQRRRALVPNGSRDRKQTWSQHKHQGRWTLGKSMGSREV